MKIAKDTGADVYVAHYPLAPKYNARIALDWLEKLYAVLVKKYPAEKITLMGDSAGANLIICLTGRVKVKPGRLLVISPACGLEDKNRNVRLAMEPYDPILSEEMIGIISDNWCNNVPLDSPDISPEYVDYTGFPPMNLYFGKHEIFYPHVENYTDILERHGVMFRKNVRNMCHDWAICRFFPEGRQAIREMSRIIKKN
jgi:acetyl esterase/lipase